jgi:hypothetical protein
MLRQTLARARRSAGCPSSGMVGEGWWCRALRGRGIPPTRNARESQIRLFGLVALDQRVGGMVVDRFEVLGFHDVAKMGSGSVKLRFLRSVQPQTTYASYIIQQLVNAARPNTLVGGCDGQWR